MVAGLIGRLRDLDWTAVKITQHPHSPAPRGAEVGGPGEPDAPIAWSEELEPNQTDS